MTVVDLSLLFDEMANINALSLQEKEMHYSYIDRDNKSEKEVKM